MMKQERRSRLDQPPTPAGQAGVPRWIQRRRRRRPAGHRRAGGHHAPTAGQGQGPTGMDAGRLARQRLTLSRSTVRLPA